MSVKELYNNIISEAAGSYDMACARCLATEVNRSWQSTRMAGHVRCIKRRPFNSVGLLMCLCNTAATVVHRPGAHKVARAVR